MKRLMKCCFNIHNTYRFLSKVVIFDIDDTSNKAFLNKTFYINENYSFFFTSAKIWAQMHICICIYILNSVVPFIDYEQAIDSIVAPIFSMSPGRKYNEFTCKPRYSCSILPHLLVLTSHQLLSYHFIYHIHLLSSLNINAAFIHLQQLFIITVIPFSI
jgi:hypothetical protein